MQIQLKNKTFPKYQRALVAMLLSLFLLAGCGPSDVPQVRVATPQQTDIKVSFLATGKTVAREVEVSAEYWGTLEEVLVAKSDAVKKGQILAVIKDVEGQEKLDNLRRDLAVQRSTRDELVRRLELRRAQLSADNSRRLAERRSAQATFREAVASASPEKIQQAEASLDEAQAKLRQVRLEVVRLEKLYDEDIVSLAQVEKAQIEEEIAVARRTQALKELEALKRGATNEARAAALAEVDIADANLEQNSQLSLELSLLEQQLQTKELEVLRLQGELATAEQRVKRGQMTSPVDGRVIEVHHSPGELINRGTSVVTVLDPKDIWVEGEVAEQDSSYVGVGQTVNVNLPAFEGKTFTGKVESIGAALRTPSGTMGNARSLPIKVRLDEEVEGLRPGIEADISGGTTLAQGVLAVPQQALVREGTDVFVVTVDNSKTQRTRVDVGVSNSDLVQVKSGLQASQKVVIENPSSLQDGTEVKIR